MVDYDKNYLICVGIFTTWVLTAILLQSQLDSLNYTFTIQAQKWKSNGTTFVMNFVSDFLVWSPLWVQLVVHIFHQSKGDSIYSMLIITCVLSIKMILKPIIR